MLSQARPDLNGKRGWVVQYLEEHERFKVGIIGTEELVGVKPCCLTEDGQANGTQQMDGRNISDEDASSEAADSGGLGGLLAAYGASDSD